MTVSCGDSFSPRGAGCSLGCARAGGSADAAGRWAAWSGRLGRFEEHRCCSLIALLGLCGVGFKN